MIRNSSILLILAGALFINPDYEEWEYYLECRRMQGFNVLQINILPQHDRNPSENYIDPFEVLLSRGWDFSRRNEKYFDKAENVRDSC